MTDASSAENLFNNVNSIGQELDFTWLGNSKVGRWNYRIAVSAWPMSVRPNGSSDVFDYFLIELNGQSSLDLRDNRPAAGYSLYVDFYQQAPAPTGAAPPGAQPITPQLPAGLELIASSPDTSVASTTYDDSISTTLGGSVGFFGDSMTGSFNASVTMSHSTSRAVADLRIENRSGVDDNVSPCWDFLVSPDSLEAEGTTPLLAQFLMRRPHSPDPLKFDVWVYVYFVNDVLGNIPESYWAGLDNFILAFYAEDMPTLEQHHARIGKRNPVQIAAPPPPPSA